MMMSLKRKGIAVVAAAASLFCFATPAMANNSSDSG
ncbi:hypothetical protein BBOH_0537 [Bifidobacterium bohemicum DSM 22767]|uniref:Uncharacterized protein n=1 Tax=Bifidobacterium bohemicum DSM 22767 TaxID=1437606 RepID=A0A086ZGT5_9BIFI|nr:hypothetical protein BBOH_0537 [Bifidobacterium bohemicum DSM 22767]